MGKNVLRKGPRETLPAEIQRLEKKKRIPAPWHYNNMPKARVL